MNLQKPNQTLQGTQTSCAAEPECWRLQMHVSRALKYVYIGIPRTGSKSMFQWLKDNYQSENVGGHHDWDVPEEFRDYLVFTIVRNPYERATSGWFFEPVIKYDHDPPQPKDFAEGMQRPIRLKDAGGNEMNQKNFVQRAGLSLVLYFERLPQALAELPFVDEHNIPPLPHNNAGGYRPAEGDFFDHFTMEDEKLVWEYAAEDFEAFGYRRFDCGLPDVANNCIHLRPKAGDLGSK